MFKSLDQVLGAIASQPEWEKQQQYRHLLEVWQAVVEPKVAQQTRPLYITKGVLWVAVSSSVWAQNLALGRYSLLKKINPQLSQPLKDLRFSTAGWHKQIHSVSSTAQSSEQKQHPSYIKPVETSASQDLSAAEQPMPAFEHWQKVIKARSQHLPLCPGCECPTPSGELKRWGHCSLCAAQQWGQSNIDS